MKISCVAQLFVFMTVQDIYEIINLLKYDKKNSDDKPMFVLLKDLGEPLFNQVVTEKEIEEAFKFYKD